MNTFRLTVDKSVVEQDWLTYERAHGVKILNGQINADGMAVIECFKIADATWFVDVYDCLPSLVFAKSDDKYIYLNEVYNLDEDKLDELYDSVVCNDNDSTINLSGHYYPRSDKSIDLFNSLISTIRLCIQGRGVDVWRQLYEQDL